MVMALQPSGSIRQTRRKRGAALFSTSSPTDLCGRNRQSVDVVVAAQRLVAARALIHEARVVAVGLQVRAAPTSPTPAFGVFVSAGRLAASAPPAQTCPGAPGHRGRAAAARQSWRSARRPARARCCRFRAAFTATSFPEDEAEGIVVAAIGGADRLPAFEGGVEGNPLNSGCTVARETRCGGSAELPHGRDGPQRRRPRGEIRLQASRAPRASPSLRMQPQELRQRHPAQLDHVDGLIERRLLRRGGLGSQGGEVQVFPRGQDVVPHQPVTGHNIVEPREPPLIRVAAIAVFFEDLRDLGGACSSAVAGLAGMPGRTNCSSTKTTTPATINLPSVLIQFSVPL